MERICTLEELKGEYFSLSLVECHRQSWSRSVWLGYENEPRFADGFLLICSDIHVELCDCDGYTLLARRGDCVYVPKGTRYTVSFEGGGHRTDVYTVNFILCDRDGCELRLSEKMDILTNEVGAECYTAASALADSVIGYKQNALRLQARFFTLLDSILEMKEERSELFYPIRRGVELMEREWNKNYDISRYSQECGMSETGFYVRFKEWSGTSPVKYRNGIRISAASSLLKNSNLSISEIASEVGFDDPYYFSRIFKKLTGRSPRQVRAEDKKNGQPSELPDELI